MTLPAATSPAEIGCIVARARAAFESGRTRPVAWRAEILRKLRAGLRDRADELVRAASADFGKPAFEAWATEIGYTIAELDHVYARFATWARERRVPTPLLFQPGSSRVLAEPLGLTCVISTWNYPVQLLVMPMIAAIAAGNAVIGKPSEFTPNTSAVLARLFSDLGDPAVAVVLGGGTEGAELLTHRFNHILYTGGSSVARTVMRAAAEHLTPVTLELGGKSPAIVSRHADISLAAHRIAWGKFFNAGQTCIAPDYVLVESAVHDDLVSALRSCIREFFGDDPKASPDLARIVSDHHFRRLEKLLHDGTVAAGGRTDATTLYVAPTILTGIGQDDPVMQEEIFGPILPVLPVSSLNAAADIVRGKDKPLALYIFSRRKREAVDVLRRASSGGVCINGTLLHVGNPYLPFGGVGQSGMGRYHGRYGFDTFSHLRAVYARNAWPELTMSYPPYTTAKEHMLRFGFALPEPRNVAAGLQQRMRLARRGRSRD